MEACSKHEWLRRIGFTPKPNQLISVLLLQIEVNDLEVAQQKSVRTLRRHILKKIKTALEAELYGDIN